MPGVEVGATTLISGAGPLKVGAGPVRTGVTAILPRGKNSKDQVFAGWFSLNGNGEMTGTTWIEEAGFLEGPILITNTHSVGVVRDASIKWSVEHGQAFTVTRDGRSIGELVPLRQRRRFVSRAEFVAMSRTAPAVDTDAFRADQDAAADQATGAYDQ